MSTYRIKQGYGYVVYGMLTIPILTVSMTAVAILVPALDYIRFVFGIVGFIAAVFAAVTTFVIFLKFVATFRVLRKENPIGFELINGVLKGYRTDYNDVFDPRKPLHIDLSTAQCRLIDAGGNMKKLKIKDSDGNEISFFSTMKFVEGSFDALAEDVDRNTDLTRV